MAHTVMVPALANYMHCRHFSWLMKLKGPPWNPHSLDRQGLEKLPETAALLGPGCPAHGRKGMWLFSISFPHSFRNIAGEKGLGFCEPKLSQ